MDRKVLKAKLMDAAAAYASEFQDALTDYGTKKENAEKQMLR